MTNTTTDIVLEAHICAARRSYRVTFEGPAAEDHAIEFIKARTATHAISEIEDEPFDGFLYTRLYDLLHPRCEHGLSADLCGGPQHWYDDPYTTDGYADAYHAGF